jgi:hypothetical protein
MDVPREQGLARIMQESPATREGTIRRRRAQGFLLNINARDYLARNRLEKDR